MAELPGKIEVPYQLISTRLTFESHLRESLRAPIPDEVSDAYVYFRPTIEQIYGKDEVNRDLLFHATGYQHYRGEKYTKTVSDDTIPALENILRSGLVPYSDRWVQTPVWDPSISFATARFYAKWYADKYFTSTSQGQLLWEYGDIDKWGLYFIATSVRMVNLPVFFSFLKQTEQKMQRSGEELNDIQRWIRLVRNDITPTTTTRNIFRGHSTIKDNWGAILVLERDTVPLVDIPVNWIYEERTTGSVPTKLFSALEVPLRKVHTARAYKRESDLDNLHIVPMECVDLHFSKFPTSQLTTDLNADKFRTRPDITYTVDQLRNNVGNVLDFSMIDRSELDALCSGGYKTSYNPGDVLRLLEKSPFFREQFSQMVNWENQTLRYHTLSVMTLFEHYNHLWSILPGGVDRKFMRLFLALHDSGKSIAVSNRQKSSHLEYTRIITESFLTQMGFGEREVKLARALLSEDSIGYYLKRVGSLYKLAQNSSLFKSVVSTSYLQDYRERTEDIACGKLQKMASLASLPIEVMTDLSIIYHQVDAGSYTTRGGSLGSLDYLFSFDTANSSGTLYKLIFHSLVQRLRDKAVAR